MLLNNCLAIAESGQTLVMERSRCRPDVHTKVRESGKVAVVYTVEAAVRNGEVQIHTRTFLADAATEIRRITYQWMIEFSPLVRPHNVRMKFLYAHGGMNPGEYETYRVFDWDVRGLNSMKLSDFGVQVGDFDLCDALQAELRCRCT